MSIKYLFSESTSCWFWSLFGIPKRSWEQMRWQIFFTFLVCIQTKIITIVHKPNTLTQIIFKLMRPLNFSKYITLFYTIIGLSSSLPSVADAWCWGVRVHAECPLFEETDWTVRPDFMLITSDFGTCWDKGKVWKCEFVSFFEEMFSNEIVKV